MRGHSGATNLRILIAIGVPRQQEAGAAAVALNHAHELEKRGHHVVCWFAEDVAAERLKWRRFQDLQFAVGVAKKILRGPEEFDVVNIHAPWGCAYGLWRKLARPAGAPPYVMTMQGSEDRFVQMMRAEHRLGRAANFGLKNRLWHRLYHQTMYDISIKTADYGAVANREGWTNSEVKYRREPGRISFVPNGTEERFFLKREFPNKQGLRLLYVGTWLDRKGVYYLAEAFHILTTKLLGVRLTVAGCLQPEEKIRKFFAAEIRDRVSVIPFVARAEMPALYAAHDVFVFPSLVEGMPLTLLEAMASAMPVVTAESSGMADVVEDGVNGLLVPPANSQRLAAAVEQVCLSQDLRKQLGEAAQTTMRQYTWERVTQKFEDVLTLAARKP
ncbi:MAG: glycosyltransferase family 4 protein [Candidatus Acidiferrales bacterium]